MYVPVCARRCMHVCAQWEVDMPDAGIKSGATGLGSLNFFKAGIFRSLVFLVYVLAFSLKTVFLLYVVSKTQVECLLQFFGVMMHLCHAL